MDDSPTRSWAARRVGGWALLVAAVLLVVAHAWRAEANHDEVEHLHAAWLVARGARPHVDFFEHHPPAFWWLLAPLARAVASPRGLLFAARLGDLLVLGATALLARRIVRRLSPAVAARWPLVLLLGSFNFVRSTMEVRPDPLMFALALAGLDGWLAHVERPRAARALAAGALFGVAALVLHKALVLAAMVGLSALVLAARHRADRARAWRLASGGALVAALSMAPLGALMAALAARGELAEFWFWNVTYNRALHWTVAEGDALWGLEALVGSFGDAPLVWATGAVGCRLALRRVRDDGRLVVLVVTGGYALFVASNRYLVDHYFQPLLLLLAILAADLFVGRPWLARLALAALPLALYRFATAPDQAAQDRVRAYVLAHTAPADRILVTPPYHPIYRDDAAYFWFGGALLGESYAALCEARGCALRRDRLDRERWDRAPPVLVFLDPRFPSYHPPGRTAWVRRSGRCRETEVPALFRCSPAPEAR